MKDSDTVLHLHFLHTQLNLFLSCSLSNLQVILINGQFPGPNIECVTNDNIIVNVINKLNEPFLITWLVFNSFLYHYLFVGTRKSC